jgi:hypothetical protein
MSDSLSFVAEVTNTTARKKALDMIYKVTLETNDSRVLSLGALPADTLLRVSVEAES